MAVFIDNSFLCNQYLVSDTKVFKFSDMGKTSVLISSWEIRCAFNKFPDFIVQTFKIVIDSWKFIMLLLYILWDVWPIFMISGSNEHLQ